MTRAAIPALPLRPAAGVMRLSEMGRAFPTRLSFLRVVLRRLAAERARVTRPVWEIDAAGHGRAVYSVALGGHDYALVAIATPLDDAERSDRVIATAWDAAFVLYDGVPDTAEIDRIARDAPRQEAARFTPRDLVLSRANRSVRLFGAIVEALATGRQPDRCAIRRTGYLMRTTAVYGNGKFGIADRTALESRPGLEGAFAAEMLTVWLIRGFTHDLVEHVASAHAGRAVTLDPALKRHLGIGNATGLGMAPFLVSHPDLLHRWVQARELALARVLAAPAPDLTRMRALHARAAAHLAEWSVDDPEAMEDIEATRSEWDALKFAAPAEMWARPMSDQTRGLLHAMLIEAHPALVDDLADASHGPEGPGLDPRMDCAELRALIERDWAFALTDWSDAEACRRFWYVSEEKLEPRIGDRHADPGAERERPLDVARRVAALHVALSGSRGPVAALLARAPRHRDAAERVQRTAALPYAEIRANLIGADCRPIDMLRFKLAMFGAAKFDPRSDLWTRICLAQGAPLRDDPFDAWDDWWLAALPS